MVVASNPETIQIFKALATQTTDIRSSRTLVHTACTNCLKTDYEYPESKMQRCATCKSVWYRSKECQKANWPKHKSTCKKIDGSGIRRLVENFYSNTLLQRHLEACFVIHFDLLNHPQLDRPFMARVDVGIEPADIANFVSIFTGMDEQLDQQKKMQGMLQINAFTPLPASEMANLTSTRKSIWRKARDGANANGNQNYSVGLVEFGNGDVGGHTITCPVFISDPALEMVRISDPWIMKSAITGQQSEVPFNIDTCMEFMNTHIRSDKKDQLLLRTPMRPSDIKIIHDAGAGVDTIAAQILSAKMRREKIFTYQKVGPEGTRSIPMVQ
ncbi:MYND-type domain-containing protein [Favolaschia claudopus]|uniref:MYND-type domain-containing protein n=1 Tax=Favolaschia claudopus TaxID=2862362 RepID=A0AAV9ZCC9_9AGAR